ncbi:T9SS type A sorting domain-containing protein [Rhodohalobacter sp. 8-1]|uniref:T9SS type A sorting domain-containing protein n=1 Tax=Rhodohalobacter sp. 8-1 TaxID=3131972 RepID=UPI0030EC9F34
MKNFVLIILFLPCLFFLPADDLSAQNRISNTVFTAGGGDSAGDLFTVSSTIGQPAGGSSYGAQFAIHSGFRQVPVQRVVTSADEATDETPAIYSLDQNYPNPFNPSTVIQYSLPEATDVTLAVYDMLGREVVSLVDGQKSAGNYEVSFSAGNLSSGIYFYRLTTGNFTKIRSMTFVK